MNENPLLLEDRVIAYEKRSHPDYVSGGMDLVSLVTLRLPRTVNLMGLIQELSQTFEIRKILEVLLSKLSLDRYKNLIKQAYDIDISMVRKVEQSKVTEFRAEFKQESVALGQIVAMPSKSLPPFVVENVDVQYDHPYDGTLYTLFDTYQVSTTVPLIAYKGYYKIYTPLYHRLNELSFRLDSDPDILQMVVDNHLIKVMREDTITVSIPSVIDPSATNLTPLKRQSETNLKGFFPIDAVNQYVVADVVTASLALSEYLVINDQVRSTDTSIQINYKHPYSPERLESTLRVYGGTARLIVRSASSMEAVEQFQYLMERVMGLYHRDYAGISRLYEQYGFTFRQVDKKLFMKSLYPEIFDAGYSRRCQPAIRVPLVIEDEGQAGGRAIMRFPMDNQVAPQRMYVCNDETFKYPGLIRTKANAFGFQPCCFKKDQSNTAKYKEYFSDAEVITDAPVYMKRTGKVLESGEYGLLPNSLISYYFDSIRVSVRRKGTSLGPNSFIECLEQTLGNGRNPRQIRQGLVELLPLFTQTMFDVSLDRVRSFIQSDEYFDPRLTVGVLEAKYNCNIIIIVKDNNNPEGGILIPRSAQGYRHYRRDGPIVAVYLHSGSEKDKLSHPHCEVLVWMDGEREVTRFDDVPMLVELENAILGPPIPMPSYPVQSQVVDSMGNARVLMVEYDGQTLQLHTPPLPPLPVEMVEYDQIRGTDPYKARSFFETYGTFTESKDGVSYGTIGHIECSLYHNSILFDDTFEIAVRNEQTARKLLNWSQWVYSQTLQQSQISVEQFFSENVVIDPNVDVLSLGPFFSRQSAVFRGGRLHLPSQTISDKLQQYLTIQVVRRPTYIRNYHTKKTLENYYQSISDFAQNYNYVITRNRDAPTVIPMVSPTAVFDSTVLPVATTVSGQVYIAVD